MGRLKGNRNPCTATQSFDMVAVLLLSVVGDCRFVSAELASKKMASRFSEDFGCRFSRIELKDEKTAPRSSEKPIFEETYRVKLFLRPTTKHYCLLLGFEKFMSFCLLPGSLFFFSDVIISVFLTLPSFLLSMTFFSFGSPLTV